MGDYFGNRQNPLKASPEELEEVFQCIAEHFSMKWLKSPKGHALQNLWKRQDFLSTNELFSFGSYLKSLSAVDPKWVKKMVNQIKTDHVNNQRGAFFEICGLGLLATATQNIITTKGNNPGFDGVLKLDTTKSIRFSLKNYGNSAHYNDFTTNSRKFENALKHILHEKKITAVQITIFCDELPTKEGWALLTKSFPTMLNEFRGTVKYFIVPEFGSVVLGTLKDDFQDFHPLCNSYSLLIFSQFHKNEDKNLLDKLDDACANLIKHSNLENDEIINMVFIHLPELASISDCKKWAENYLATSIQKPITGIILYQPTVSRDLDKDTTFIHHCVQFVFRNDNYLKWNASNKNISFAIQVGLVSDTPSENKLVYEINGKTETIDLKRGYLYQQGNWYLEGKKKEDGSIVGNMKNFGSGIFTHSVIQIAPDQPPFQISAKYPPDDKLLIL